MTIRRAARRALMLRAPQLLILLLLGMAALSVPAGAQLPVEDWTERPDAHAPAAIGEDRILPPLTFEALYTLRVRNHEGIILGSDELPPILILQDWEMAATELSVVRHELEIRAGILDWLGASLRLPVETRSATFVTQQFSVGSVSTTEFGDPELHLLYGLHDMWPYRAHISLGVSAPTGPTDTRGVLPNAPSERRLLPYPLQIGDGTWALLPAATFVAENAAGTVGMRAQARIPLGENNRGWTRGTEVNADLWMGYRFSPWISGSARLSFTQLGNVSGIDMAMNPLSSPLAHPDVQGGNRVALPIGVNILFPQGPLRGNRLSAEVFLPVRQDLDGPQVKPSYGLTVSWGIVAFQ